MVLNLRPTLLIFLMLLSQAAQGMLFAHKAPVGCGGNKSGPHACCAWMAEALGTSACSCIDSKEKPAQPEPASIPSHSSRDRTAQIMGFSLVEDLFVAPAASVPVEIKTQLDPRNLLSQPHVRLPVLFCSILI